MAGIELRQQMKLQQQLVMTPQLQQAIKLLQLSRIELLDMVHTEMEENPVLEENLEVSPEGQSQSQYENEARETPEKETSESLSNEVAMGSQEIDWEKYLENHANQLSAGSYNSASNSEELPPLEATLGAKTSLTDHLMWQLQMTLLTPEEEAFISLVIGSLDSDGYLIEANIEDLAAETGLESDEAEEVLKVLHGFDPVGVGARNLRECLLAQVDAYDLDIDVRNIIEKHLHNLERRNYKAIAKDMELDLEDVYEVAKIIAGLEPKPARNFISEDPRYITPDVFVHKIGDKYFVVSNDDGLPRLKISNFFKGAMEKGNDAKEYVQNKMRSAQWLIRSIDQRRRTITRVTECIVEKQKDFFDRGVNYLKPLILKDVAETVGMHESTISRVTTNKYVQTPRGLFELKYFFNSSIKRTESEDIASESVKMNIKEIIDGENTAKPFSDQKIVNILKENGIVIARRTVAKYREMLGILSSAQRKKLF